MGLPRSRWYLHMYTGGFWRRKIRLCALILGEQRGRKERNVRKDSTAEDGGIAVIRDISTLDLLTIVFGAVVPEKSSLKLSPLKADLIFNKFNCCRYSHVLLLAFFDNTSKLSRFKFEVLPLLDLLNFALASHPRNN